MTQHEIEVQTTETRTVETCDECGLGEERGELVTFRAQDLDEPAYGEIHYHRECMDRIGIRRPETTGDVADRAVEENASVVLAPTAAELAVLTLGLGVVLASTAAASASGDALFALPGVGGLGAVVYAVRSAIARGSLLSDR